MCPCGGGLARGRRWHRACVARARRPLAPLRAVLLSLSRSASALSPPPLRPIDPSSSRTSWTTFNAHGTHGRLRRCPRAHLTTKRHDVTERGEDGAHPAHVPGGRCHRVLLHVDLFAARAAAHGGGGWNWTSWSARGYGRRLTPRREIPCEDVDTVCDVLNRLPSSTTSSTSSGSETLSSPILSSSALGHVGGLVLDPKDCARELQK
ncbi:hypothetical protein B0H11DRAFT_1050417 [Mycena galericulata]|nr:hypothetical protein B0H11DRAFT_1050417 [Mycena galericulata]